MYNLNVIDKVGMPHVMSFIAEKLAEFDTSSVEWIKLLPLKKILYYTENVSSHTKGQLKTVSWTLAIGLGQA